MQMLNRLVRNKSIKHEPSAIILPCHPALPAAYRFSMHVTAAEADGVAYLKSWGRDDSE